ncbi:hypothetical protein [Desulfotignum phosphitoxidans]|nr:hypothetical protein [Desulfotignum phosphitoxidans]
MRTVQWFRKIASRNKWSMRLLGLPQSDTAEDVPGLVLIQIDGLSMTQFQKALQAGRLPFLEKQLRNGRWGYKPMYSGMPSTTPAFQGELFYGVKSCVPAFEFISRSEQKRHVSFYPQTANRIGDRLEKSGTPLLSGGHTYATIFTGGAAQARYCSQTMTLESIASAVNPLKLVFLLILHTGKFVRILGVTIIEFFLAVTDFFRGVVQGRKFIKELVFIPARILICVILRELVSFRTKLAVGSGVPIVCASFLGYDEQAHRRNPDSMFAHWSLKGIDDSIKDICKAADQSDCRKYKTIIYSDHGQETVTWYGSRYGIPVKEAIRNAFYELNPDEKHAHSGSYDNVLDGLYKKARALIMNRRFSENLQKDSGPVSGDKIEITTMGPLGHVYLPGTPTRDFISRFAQTLIRSVHIPLVLYRDDHSIVAMNQHGTFDLEQQFLMVLGKDHPFAAQTAEDLARVCRHPDAGDIVISGWDPTDTPLSFNIESGAHGGPGWEETRGMVVLPQYLNTKKTYLRARDLRHLIQDYRNGYVSHEHPENSQL